MTAKDKADEIIERRLSMRPGDGYMGIAFDIAKAIEDAVNEEREAWFKASGISMTGPCACIGCTHAVHCRCRCPECRFEIVRSLEREACKKIAHDMATRELLYAPEQGGSHPFDAARRIYAKQIAEEIDKRGQA